MRTSYFVALATASGLTVATIAAAMLGGAKFTPDSVKNGSVQNVAPVRAGMFVPTHFPTVGIFTREKSGDGGSQRTFMSVRTFALPRGTDDVTALFNAQGWIRELVDDLVVSPGADDPLTARPHPARTSESRGMRSAASAVPDSNAFGVGAGSSASYDHASYDHASYDHGLAHRAPDARAPNARASVALTRTNDQRARVVTARNPGMLVHAARAATGVPEPGTLALLVAAFAIMCGRLLLGTD